MENDDIYNAIEWYQSQSLFHPLTCGKDSRHDLIVPRHDGNDVILKCPTCGFTQRHVPNFILRYFEQRDAIEAEGLKILIGK